MGETDAKRPWLEKHGDTWEVNPNQTGGVRVNVGTEINVEVDKLYGPLAAHKVRVRLDGATAEWVVERAEVEGEAWVEMARWDCQLGFEESESNEREQA